MAILLIKLVAMQLRTYIPARLQGLVDMIWEQRDEQPKRWRFLPSGKVELIFRIGTRAGMESACRMSSEDNPLEYSCFLSGLHTRPFTLYFDHFHYMGVQMKPVAVKAIFGLPLNEIRDYYAPGEALFNTMGLIEEELSEQQGFLGKASWLEEFLYSRIADNADLHSAIKLYRHTERYIRENRARPESSLEDMLGYSRAQTWRIFRDWFGLSAHSWQQLARCVNAMHLLHSGAGNLTRCGLESGYYDQSHFIRSFRRFTGMTPGEYRRQMSHLPGQLPG